MKDMINSKGNVFLLKKPEIKNELQITQKLN